MSQLFVDDDDMAEDRKGYRPSTTTIKEENDEDEIMAYETRQGSADNQTEPSSAEDDDDPIIESIPLVMNQVPTPELQSIHLLQYPGRPKSRPLSNTPVSASIKPDSHYLNLKLPIDPTKFFNLRKIEDWGESIDKQSISGVLDPVEQGIYAGKVVNDGIERKVVLTPIDSTAQLRTSFKYIDNLDKETLQQRKLEAQQERHQERANVQILQTAAKHSTQNQDTHSHSLGDSLKSVKKFDEEEWKYLSWKTGGHEDTSVESLKLQLKDGADGIQLKNQTTYDAFIDHLYS
ncbi:hypothetical protein CANMA_004301 [Candida margitis]|uniref:uncharacterized protein n=1 Tax=Candida margitis TaxID=1775924 RepID=UPI0022261E98|nr:uncharacterized protein CANMA_004301 [Candida margitis]KAI5958147.1 hypothetical protein CANMA_004301 [Candida margitis]